MGKNYITNEEEIEEQDNGVEKITIIAANKRRHKH